MELRQAAAVTVIFCLGRAAGLAQDAGPKTIIRAEKKLVLVDAVVTDKKGNYLHDLTAKDFRVWEDNKEQQVETFSFEAGPASPLTAQKHYLVLFFDNSSMQIGDQVQARQAALRFLDANTGPNRLVAIVNFGGSLQIAQNFTGDANRLKQVVAGVRTSATSPNQDAVLSKAAADFGARDVLLALRSMAKSLATVPGRKTLIFLSAGFKLDAELRSELTAVLDVCNKANVAIYPIDVRGLVASGPRAGVSGESAPLGGAFLVRASFMQQRSGGGTAGGAGSRGSRGGPPAAGAGARGGGGIRTPRYTNGPFSQPRTIVPHLPDVMSNQDVLYALASGTGGFVIVNTNDLVGGLQKIANEQNEYYILGYSPSKDSADGSCHELKVKVDRGGTNVRARSGYCTPKPVDLLAGTATERELEAQANGTAAAGVKASMELPFFYTSPNTARVDVAMDIPPAALKFEKEKGKLRSEMNVLGIAYDSEGSVAARFSDTVKLEFENKKEVEKFQEQPMHYDAQFDIASGKYEVKIVFSAGGEGFGKLQMPLAVDPYDSSKFSLSGVALSQNFHKVSELDAGLDAALLEDHTPLVSQGMQITPSGSNVFSKAEPAAIYVEIYEPLLAGANPPKVGLRMRLLDRKSGEQKLDTGFVSVAAYSREGNPVVPVGMRLPLETLAAGSYRAEFKAIDASGNSSMVRSADFDVQ